MTLAERGRGLLEQLDGKVIGQGHTQYPQDQGEISLVLGRVPDQQLNPIAAVLTENAARALVHKGI